MDELGGRAAPLDGGGVVARETEAGGWIWEVGGWAEGSGSVAGREMAPRGGIWDEGILPPGMGGRPPVGARDEARGL